MSTALEAPVADEGRAYTSVDISHGINEAIDDLIFWDVNYGVTLLNLSISTHSFHSEFLEHIDDVGDLSHRHVALPVDDQRRQDQISILLETAPINCLREIMLILRCMIQFIVTVI